MTNKQIPPEGMEAAVSVTFKVSYKGIEVLMTNRDKEIEIKPYFEKAKTAIDWALANGFETPPARSFGGYQKKERVFVEGKKCSICGGRVEKKRKADGKEYYVCENNKYDFTTKQNTGCQFFEWVQPVQSAGVPERQINNDYGFLPDMTGEGNVD